MTFIYVCGTKILTWSVFHKILEKTISVFLTFTFQKQIVERFWGYRVVERIKTHRLSTKPALYDPQTYEFFRFYEKKPFRIFDVYPSYFDRIPEFVRPKFRARQRATFMFLIHVWASWKTYFKILQKHFKMFQSAEHAKFAPGARILHVHSRPGTRLGRFV